VFPFQIAIPSRAAPTMKNNFFQNEYAIMYAPSIAISFSRVRVKDPEGKLFPSPLKYPIPVDANCLAFKDLTNAGVDFKSNKNVDIAFTLPDHILFSGHTINVSVVCPLSSFLSFSV
jgi:hypothetical protein